MNIVIAGAVVANGGDAAIMAAQLQILDRELSAGDLVIIHDAYPDIARTLFPGRHIESPWHTAIRPASGHGYLRRTLRRISERRLVVAARLSRLGIPTNWATTARERQLLKEAANTDVVAYTGGTSLTERYDIGPKLFDLEFAIALGKTLVFLTQTLGPFRAGTNARRVRKLCSNADLVLLRDKRSLSNLKAIGADVSRSLVFPDIAFSLASLEAVHRAAAAPANQMKRVAISVRDPSKFFERSSQDDGYGVYVSSIAGLVEYLVRAGSFVTFLSTCQGISKYRYDDSIVADDVIARLPQGVACSVSVDRQHRGPDDLMRAYAGFDLVVATRLHAGILALNAGTPVLPIAYEAKTFEVFEALGAGEFTLNIDDLSVTALVRTYLRFVEWMSENRKAYFTAVACAVDGARAVSVPIRQVVFQRK